MSTLSQTRVAERVEPPEYDWENTRTLALMVETSSPVASYRDAFIRNFRAIRAISDRLVRPGVAVVAIDAYRGSVAGSFVVAAKTGLANSAIIGRHDRSDLWLTHDESLSLRHLAVIVDPLAVGSTDVRFRVVDLRSRTGFRDERDRQLEAVVADGSVFVRCAGYILLVVRTEDVARWPESGREAWDQLPDRVFHDEREADLARAGRLLAEDRRSARRSRRSRRRRPDSRRGRGRDDAGPDNGEDGDERNPWSRMTAITLTSGPVRASVDELLAPGEVPLGTLAVTSRRGARDLVIGRRAAESGILIGRYSRCDGEGMLDDCDPISRIHLLIIRVGKVLYAIDTASKNGTSSDDCADVRILPLGRGASIHMAKKMATVTWRPA